MNFILYISFVTYFSLLGVKCRSVQIDSDVHSVLVNGEDSDGNHDPESSGRFSWKRLKPILRREVQRIRNVIGETSETDDESVESTSISTSGIEDANVLYVDGENKGDSLKTNPEVTDSSMESELTRHNPDEELKRKTNMPGEIPTNKTDHEIHQLEHLSVKNDSLDNVVIDILNRSSDSILLQVLNDNSSETGSLVFDETSLLSEGGHVATLQEVSTVGFELLIDSETKKNSILAEILHSASNLFDDEFESSTDENVLNIATEGFTHINDSEFQDILTESELSDNSDVELDDYKNETEIAEFQEENEIVTLITEFYIANKTESITEFHIDNDGTTQIIKSHMDNEVGTEDNDFGTDENTEISIDEITNIMNRSELSNSVAQDFSVTENKRTESKIPKCPDPGWCIFWFFALDTCAKDGHCHGSLMCCMIGCQKTCIEPEFS